MLNRLLFPLFLATATLPFADAQIHPELESTIQPFKEIHLSSFTDKLEIEDVIARYRPDSRRGSGRRAILG